MGGLDKTHTLLLFFYKNINYLYLIIIKKADYLLNIDFCVFLHVIVSFTFLKRFTKHKK